VAQALQAYEQAAALDATFPDPSVRWAFLYYQSRQSDKAKEAFRKYLALKPDAPDSRRIKEYLVELER
jgi:tetratricopeptide (TPR) repeat protein